MKTSKNLTEWIDESKKSDSFWIEETKLNYSMALEKQLRASGLSYSALAKKIGTSAAYITKVFRGDSNLTIESMVKLARATGGRLNIYIANEASSVGRWDKLPKQALHSGEPQTVIGSATIIQLNSYQPANDGHQVREAA